jgi:outer membrane protein OmpA-like peptidoglycan-associated protein
MSFNLLDAAKGLFTNELVGKASSFLGESESGVTKALGGILPSVLGGLIDKSSSHDGANMIANAANEQHSSGLLDNIGSFFGNDGGGMLNKGAGLLSGLFGDKTNALTSLISNFAGVKSSTSSSLLSMAAPMVLSMLGKHAASNNMGASGIASLLSSQKSSIASAMPAGLNLSSVLGGFGGNTSETVSHAKATATNYASDVEEKSGGAMKFLLPLLLLAALGAGVWYFTKDGCGKKGEDVGGTGTDTTHNSGGTTTGGEGTATNNTTAAMPTVTIDSATGLVSYDLGAPMDLELPGGVKLAGVATNGFENNLVNFIKTGTIDTVNKAANWLDLHNVQFKSGTTIYAGNSEAQVKNAGAILKAYPNVKIKVGGYTDASGDAAKNKALSQSRADKVKADIIAAGAKADQIIEAKGYGSEFAKAAAGDKVGMARDRKVACKVTMK